MEKTVYNPHKGRLETINIDFTDENTTWFDSHENIEEIYMVTDFEGGLMISGYNYDYPTLVYDISRSDINDDISKALDLKKMYMETQEYWLSTGMKTPFRYAPLRFPACGGINIRGKKREF